MTEILSLIILFCPNVTLYTSDDYACRRTVIRCVLEEKSHLFETNKNKTIRCMKIFLKNYKKKQKLTNEVQLLTEIKESK